MTEKNGTPTTATEDLLKIVQQMNAGMKTILTNQEKFQAEQERMAKALGETGICLQRYNETFTKHTAALINHQEVIEKNGAAIARLWQEAGLALNDAPEAPPPSAVN